MVNPALLATLMAIQDAFSATTWAQAMPPSIESALRPEVYKKVVSDQREIATHATLESLESQAGGNGKNKRYSFYGAMLVKAPLKLTHDILTDYALYPRMISYVDHADYAAAAHVLSLEGGIWGWRLHSWLKFEDRSDRWVHFRIIAGHFAGLEGDIVFEPRDEKGTLVWVQGAQSGTDWPPKFIVERGAEIVFAVTANRMRSYIQSQKETPSVPQGSALDQGKHNHDPAEIPQPRTHL